MIRKPWARLMLIIAAVVGAYYGIHYGLDSSRGTAVLLAAFGTLSVFACLTIFWMTRAYYDAEAEPVEAPAESVVPKGESRVAAIPAGSLKGRKSIKLAELAKIWLPDVAAARTGTDPAGGGARAAVKAQPAQERPKDPEPVIVPEDELAWNQPSPAPAEAQGIEGGDEEDGEGGMMSGFSATEPEKRPDPPAGKQGVADDEDIVFVHDQIVDYYNDRIVTKPKGFAPGSAALRTVESILKLLDKHGDCPSVVVANTDGMYTDTDLDRLREDYRGFSTHEILSRVTLLDHSLEVARRIEGMRKGSAQTPVWIIEALAHDLGKIPSYHYSRSYATGDHPIISCTILQSEVRGFMDLSERDRKDVENAVRNHHRGGFDAKDADIEHVKLLADADKDARSTELAREFKVLADARQASDAQRSAIAENERKQKELEEEKEKQRIAETMRAFEKYGMDLSWVDSREFFRLLMPYINEVRGGCYKAVSTNDGIVYVWSDLLRKILNEMAHACGQPDVEADVIASDGNLLGKYKKLISITNKFRDEGLIPAQLIQPGYFSANFLVFHDGKPEPDRMNACPFLAEAFGVLPGELEGLKDDPLVRDIINITVDPSPGKKKRKKRHAPANGAAEKADEGEEE